MVQLPSTGVTVNFTNNQAIGGSGGSGGEGGTMLSVDLGAMG